MNEPNVQKILDVVRQFPTIRSLLEDRARMFGDKTFVAFYDSQVSYREMDERANQVANSLQAMGVGKGDKVALMMPNCLEFLYLWFGVSKIGAILVPVNTALKGYLLAYQLNHAEVETFVIDSRMIGNFAKEEIVGLKRLIVHRTGTDQLPDGAIPFEQLLDGSSSAPAVVEINQSDTNMIIFTSGTTGPSKGCMLTNRFYVYNGSMYPVMWGLTGDDTYYSCTPLFHIMSLGAGVMVALTTGGRFVLGEKFDPGTFWDDMRRYGCNHFNFVGAMIQMLWKNPPRPDDADNPVKVAMGQAMPMSIFRAFEERFALQIKEGYGLTENGGTTILPQVGQKPGSVGKPTPFYEMKIVDELDEEVGPNEVGEILHRCTIPWVNFTGYYKMPQETVDAWQNLWFHTGDYGYKDEDGHFWFVDRKKDAIRRRGENISSFEMEKIIYQNPKVLECAVIAVRSPMTEDDVKAIIVLKPGEEMSHEEFLDWCQDQMAYFQVPRYVEFLSNLPKTATMRVQKFLLRQEGEVGVTPTTWDREKEGYKLRKD